MMFQVKYRDNKGKIVSGVFQAPNRNIVFLQLQKKGALPLEILEQDAGPEVEIEENAKCTHSIRGWVICSVFFSLGIVCAAGLVLATMRMVNRRPSIAERVSGSDSDQSNVPMESGASRNEKGAKPRAASDTIKNTVRSNAVVVESQGIVEDGPSGVSQRNCADGNVAVGAQAAEGQYYTVRDGDTLFTLAISFYGRRSAWKFIRDANKNLISCDGRIHADTVLYIPSVAEVACDEQYVTNTSDVEAEDSGTTLAKSPDKEQRKAEIEFKREARKLAREAAEMEKAEKLGISVEDYRAQRRAQREAKAEEKNAKLLGVSVDEYRAMSPEQRKMRIQEMRVKRMSEHKSRLKNFN